MSHLTHVPFKGLNWNTCCGFIPELQQLERPNHWQLTGWYRKHLMITRNNTVVE